jgi:hypothetical protein
MRFPRALNSRHLFLYAGFGLIFLTLVVLPIKIQVNVQSPEFPDYEDFSIGLFYAPVIGSYGLACLVLGIAESAAPKQRVWAYLLPIFILIYIGLAFAAAILFYPVNRANWSWWVYFGLLLGPSALAHAVALLHFTRKETLAKALENPKVRIPVFVVLMAVPLLFSAALLFTFIVR